MLKNFGQLRTECQQYLGLTVLDESTDPPLSLLNTMINDGVRESLSRFNFRQLETSLMYPFQHTISGVQGLYLSGISTTPVAGSGISTTILPYPSGGTNILFQQTYLDSSTSFSGNAFVGTDILGTSYSGTVTSWSGTTGPLTTIGYQYQLPSSVDQIYSISIPQNSIKLLFIPQYDIERVLPNSILVASGTPAYYTEFQGMSPQNTKSIMMFPQPTLVPFSGQSFMVHCKKMHQDMIADTDVQNVLPENYQDIIVWAALERAFGYLSDEKFQLYKNKKEERMGELEVWSGNQLDYVYQVRDGNFLGSSYTPFQTSILFRI